MKNKVIILVVFSLILIISATRLAQSDAAKIAVRDYVKNNDQVLLHQNAVLECELSKCRGEIPDGPEYNRGFLKK